jgi:hypothetical protein
MNSFASALVQGDGSGVVEIFGEIRFPSRGAWQELKVRYEGLDTPVYRLAATHHTS